MRISADRKKRLASAFAAVFLLLLFAEWGSHSIIPSTSESPDAPTISSARHMHDDPCDSLILCPDSGRKDKQMPGAGQEVSHYNFVLDLFPELYPPQPLRELLRIEFSAAAALSRAVGPPFHPPELS